MDKFEVAMNAQMNKEFQERMFGRMCLILSQHNNEVEIPFTAYDRIEAQIKVSNEVKPNVALANKSTLFSEDRDIPCLPSFVTEDTVNKFVFMRIVEKYTKSNVEPIVDILEAAINPALCKDKKITTKEDEEKQVLVVKLVRES